MNLEAIAAEPIITFDVDWAPDWMIAEVAELVLSYNVKTSWFVTHRSPAIERLFMQSSLIEIGLHPNCLPGSTHGTTPEAALAHLRSIFPDATTMRTHGLYQSSRFLYQARQDFGISVDVSLFLPHATHLFPHTLPVDKNRSLIRIPFFWEDDSEMLRAKPQWKLDQFSLREPGLKIFNFHPVHIVLNSSDFSDYERLKAMKPVHEWTAEDVAPVRTKAIGPRSLLEEILAKTEGQGCWMRDIAATVR